MSRIYCSAPTKFYRGVASKTQLHHLVCARFFEESGAHLAGSSRIGPQPHRAADIAELEAALQLDALSKTFKIVANATNLMVACLIFPKSMAGHEFRCARTGGHLRPRKADAGVLCQPLPDLSRAARDRSGQAAAERLVFPDPLRRSGCRLQKHQSLLVGQEEGV